MSKRALIIVDMLNDFIDKNGALFCGDTARSIIPFVKQRLDAFRNRGDLIIYLQDSHDKNDKEFERFPSHCVTGTRGNEIISELTPKPGDKVIPKKRYSGFYGTELETILESEGVDEVEVVGVCTSICVMDTVGGLANRDYNITVPIKGVADFDPNFHEFALKRMKQLYGASVS
ncbi:MAG: cysteine hydrolase [Deltaproteobacteria bacterium]|nr:cysteine hydrolase [Deltaproteobacteria bacterium]